jgi:hypothetical protein
LLNDPHKNLQVLCQGIRCLAGVTERLKDSWMGIRESP